MHRAGDSAGLFYLSRAVQRFLHVQQRRIIMFILNPTMAQRDVPHIKHISRTRKYPQLTFAWSRRCPLKRLIGLFYVSVPHEEENAEKPKRRCRLGLDLYRRNYTAMADLQISPFSAAPPPHPPAPSLPPTHQHPPLCLDAAQDSRLRPCRYRGLDQRADVSSDCKKRSALIQPDF